MRCSSSNGDLLLLLSSAVASQIAHNRPADEISILAALFTLIGDSLALLASVPNCNQQKESDPLI